MNFTSKQETVIQSGDGISLESLLQPAEQGVGSALLVHGFGVDLHEEGAFDRLAARLTGSGISVARVSFRGHGRSAGTQEGMTISGERLDLSAAYSWMKGHMPPPFSIVAASFGAVATLLQLEVLKPAPCAMVFWNPVFEISSVFVDPVSPWGLQNFGKDAYEAARSQGYSLVDGTFKVGWVLLDELRLYPGNLAVAYLSKIPALILHGTSDTYVPIASSKEASRLEGVELIEILGSDHGFPDPDTERLVIESTTEWLVRKMR